MIFFCFETGHFGLKSRTISNMNIVAFKIIISPYIFWTILNFAVSKQEKVKDQPLSCNSGQLSTSAHKCHYSFSHGRSDIWLAWKEKSIYFVSSNFDQWLDYDWSCPKQNSTLYWQNHYFICSRVSSSIYCCLHIRNISSKVVEYCKGMT